MRLEKDDLIVIEAKKKFLEIDQTMAIGLATIAYLFDIPGIDANFVNAVAKSKIIKAKQQNRGKEVECTIRDAQSIYAAYVAKSEYLQIHSKNVFHWENITGVVPSMVRQDIMFREEAGRHAVDNFYATLGRKI